MSTVELRRGEQSALHCSGTRTLQVRSLSNPAKESEEETHASNWSNLALGPLSASVSPGFPQQNVPPLLVTLLNPECLPFPMHHPYMVPRPYSILSQGEPRCGVPLWRRTGRGAHAGGRVQSLRCEAPG
jgi:hypothetical protein